MWTRGLAWRSQVLSAQNFTYSAGSQPHHTPPLATTAAAESTARGRDAPAPPLSVLFPYSSALFWWFWYLALWLYLALSLALSLSLSLSVCVWRSSTSPLLLYQSHSQPTFLCASFVRFWQNNGVQRRVLPLQPANIILHGHNQPNL